MHLLSLFIAGILFAQQSAESPTLAARDTSATSAEKPLGGTISSRGTAEAGDATDGSDASRQDAGDTDDGRVSPLRSGSGRVTPEELVSRALSSTEVDELPGQPVSLVTALSNVRGQSERIAAVQAYWQSTLALAKYGVALDESRQLKSIDPAASTTASDAAVEAARLDTIEAQRRLAKAARLPNDVQLPLPSDRPHVKAYKTLFAEIFSSSTPMDRLWLIDRRLPIGLEVIEVRTSAVQAAEDVVVAMTDAHQKGEVDATSVAAAIAELARQRRAYLEAVHEYNREIADYALNVVGQEVTGRRLVATLIDLDRNPPTAEKRPGGASESRRQSGVQRAEFIAPIESEERGYWEPTPAVGAPPRRLDPATNEDEQVPKLPLPPSDSPPGETTSSRLDTSGWTAPREAARPTVSRVEIAQSDDGGQRPEVRSYARRPLVPVERTVFRLPMKDASAARYADLAGAAAEVQAGQLASELFPNAAEDFKDSQLLDLRDCFADLSPQECHAVVNAYWLARLRACEHQAFTNRTEELAELFASAVPRASEPLGSENVMRLRVVRLSSDAAVLEARARLLEAQYDLTVAMKRPLDSPWLLPRTSPRCGEYPLNLGRQPRSLVESWPVRRLALTVPILSETVFMGAAGVVEADAARSAAMNQFAGGTLPMDQVTGAIRAELEHTLAFLDTVTEYNRSIAEYVVLTEPEDADKIAERLLGPVESAK